MIDSWKHCEEWLKLVYLGDFSKGLTDYCSRVVRENRFIDRGIQLIFFLTCFTSFVRPSPIFETSASIGNPRVHLPLSLRRWRHIWENFQARGHYWKSASSPPLLPSRWRHIRKNVLRTGKIPTPGLYIDKHLGLGKIPGSPLSRPGDRTFEI